MRTVTNPDEMPDLSELMINERTHESIADGIKAMKKKTRQHTGSLNDDLVSRYSNFQMMPIASRMSSYMITKKANEKNIANMNNKIAFSMINVKATRTNDVQSFMKFYHDKIIPA